MAEVGSAFLSIVPSARGFRGQLEAQTSPGAAAAGKSAGSRFSSGMASSLKAIGIATVAASAVSFIKGSIAEAREAQKVGALTAQVIKTTGGAANVSAKQVGALSAAISKKTGIDDEAIQSGANMLLTFTNVRNEAGKGNKIFDQATRTITDMGAALGQDTKSSAIQLGKALNDPIKGVTALSRVGVAFTDEQKQQIKTMVQAGNVTGAQKVILAELSKEFGGAAAAQATAGDKASVAWGNLQETIGAKLAPALDKLLLGLTKVFTFIGAHQSVMIAIGTIVGVILVAALVAATAAVWSFTVALLANPIVWIIIAIIALVAAIVLIVKHWDIVKKKTAEVWAAIKSKLSSVWGTIKSKAAAVWQAVKDWISRKWDEIKATVTSKGAAVLAWFRALPGKLMGLVRGAGRWLLNIGRDIITGLGNGIKNSWTWVKGIITDLGGNIVRWAKNALHIGSPSKLMADEVGRWIPAGIAVGIDRNAGAVHSSLASLTSDLAVNARVSARTGLDIGASSAATPRPTAFILRSGELRLVGDKAFVTGVLEEHVFDMGMATA